MITLQSPSNLKLPRANVGLAMPMAVKTRAQAGRHMRSGHCLWISDGLVERTRADDCWTWSITLIAGADCWIADARHDTCSANRPTVFSVPPIKGQQLAREARQAW